MKYSFFKFSALFVAFVATASLFTACQKDTPLLPSEIAGQEINASDRAGNGLLFGVTVFTANNPSVLVSMDPINQTVIGQVNVTYNGNPINDLKGVCCVGTRLYVSTGFNAVDALSNLLLEVDPQTGLANFVSQSTVGTVSDIDYNPFDNQIYGLRNNTNRLVVISGANFQNYAVFNFTLPFSNNSIARGLAFTVPDPGSPNVITLKVSAIATSTLIGTARLFRIPFVGGVGTLETQLAPNNDLAGGHCGVGFVRTVGPDGSLFINRNANTTVPGLNFYQLTFPVPNITNTAPTAIAGFNFEDLSNVN